MGPASTLAAITYHRCDFVTPHSHFEVPEVRPGGSVWACRVCGSAGVHSSPQCYAIGPHCYQDDHLVRAQRPPSLSAACTRRRRPPVHPPASRVRCSRLFIHHGVGVVRRLSRQMQRCSTRRGRRWPWQCKSKALAAVAPAGPPRPAHAGAVAAPVAGGALRGVRAHMCSDSDASMNCNFHFASPSLAEGGSHLAAGRGAALAASRGGCCGTGVLRGICARCWCPGARGGHSGGCDGWPLYAVGAGSNSSCSSGCR